MRPHAKSVHDIRARLARNTRELNPRFYGLIAAFAQRTGVPLVLNTSFNVRGQPIVCTPEDAVETFMTSSADILVLGDYLLDRTANDG